MANFWKITKRDHYWTAMKLKKILPELKDSYCDDIAENLRGSGISIVSEENVKSPGWIRLTLPFGLILLVILFILSPIKFMISGKWGYKWQWLSNWFKALQF